MSGRSKFDAAAFASPRQRGAEGLANAMSDSEEEDGAPDNRDDIQRALDQADATKGTRALACACARVLVTMAASARAKARVEDG